MFCMRFKKALGKYLPTQSVDDLEDDVEECGKVNIVLMTGIKDLNKYEIFVVEASKSAVIETAFTKTVVGEKWYQNIRTNLSNTCKAQIGSFPSDGRSEYFRAWCPLKGHAYSTKPAAQNCRFV